MDFFNNFSWQNIVFPLILIAIGVILYFFIRRILIKIFDNPKRQLRISRRQRVDTIRIMLTNLIKYILIAIIILAVLSMWGVNVSSLVAGLGIMTAIIGLAFQDLAKDIIAGFSIITEDQYAVGDIIEIDGFCGKVIFLGLKTTKVQNFYGEVKIFSNSTFSTVINYSNEKILAEVKVGVPYGSDHEKINSALEKVKQNLEQRIKSGDELLRNIKGDITIHGITDFADSAEMWCIRFSSHPRERMHQESCPEIRKEIANAFRDAKIEIPYQTITLNTSAIKS
ncbi:MAG: mechanosensitive ion channel family protein [Candidatus Saccharibacteria bacterium]|nr:mechanosensitive ion channel family protein [Candidatus Saccharibacteria bacterium]